MVNTASKAHKIWSNCVFIVFTSLLFALAPYIETNCDGDMEFTGVALDSICEALPEYAAEVIFYTLFELDDGGHISLSEGSADDVIENCCVNYITYAGHEFLNTIRANPTWEKTLDIAGEIGNFSLRILEKIAEGVAAAVIKQKLGLP